MPASHKLSHKWHPPPGSVQAHSSRAAQPDAEQNSEVVTIVLLGLSQAGKSTFVNWLRRISQTPSDEALEGNGNKACTKKCGVWEMKIQLSDYKLVDCSPVSKDIQLPTKERDLLREKGRWTNANSRLVPTTPNARVVTFRVTDTPGLDDGDQDDSKNITEVLGTMNQWLRETDNPTVNGIVFLISATSAFSSSFQELFKYYNRCMPDLFGGLIMVNTKFSVKTSKGMRRQLEESNEIEDSEAARARISQQRRFDFAGLLGRNPPHWHLDSKPDPEDNLEVLLSLNSTIDLLRVVASQEPSKINHMNYVKMTGDKSVDAKIIMLVKDKKHFWWMKRKLIMDKSSAKKKLYVNNQERLLEYEQKICDLDTELSNVDHEEWVTLNMDHTPLTDDVGWFTKATRMTKWGGVAKRKFVNEKYDFYQVDFLDNDTSKWEKSEKEPGTDAYIGFYKASRGSFPLLYTRSKTRSSVKNLEDIRRWRK